MSECVVAHVCFVVVPMFLFTSLCVCAYSSVWFMLVCAIVSCSGLSWKTVTWTAVVSPRLYYGHCVLTCMTSLDVLAQSGFCLRQPE